MPSAAKMPCLAIVAVYFAAGGGWAAGQQHAEKLTAWVQQLDADEFLTRETATANLLKAGPAALPALKAVLQHGSLEATSRAFYVVRELGLAASLDEGAEAWDLLNELAARKEVPTIARRASQALADLTQQRSGQALAELERLGARVERADVVGGLAIDPATYLEIGPAFRGQTQDLRRLKWVADVPQVVLTGERATDAWVQAAAAMAALEELHLYQTRVTDAGLAALAGHERLGELGLYYTPTITDAALEPLAKLPSLRFVKLYGTRATAERAAQVRAQTGLAIDFRRGAFLGVGCTPLDGNCKISSIHKNSPAERAGLQEDDVIIRFGESPITNFDSLTSLIRQNADGEEVEVEVRRVTFDKDGAPSSQNVVAKVKFTPWELKAAVQQPLR